MATNNARASLSNGPAEFPPEFRSWSIRNLLGSYRRENETIDSASAEMQSPKYSPARISSPLTQGSPMKTKLLTPSRTFARIKEEKDEKSKMTRTPEELLVKDGIKLPLLGQVRWEDLKRNAMTWLSKPRNVVLLLWLIAVAVTGAILFMVMVGMLNKVLPKKSDRDRWFEITNQILNGLFTVMALYNHPIRILHLHYLIRYNPRDIIKLRETYCKGGLRKPHEWAHILVVVLLLHLNCVAQYALAGLNWGYRRADRPAIGVGITLFLSFGAAAAAGMYNSLSPLGKDYFPDSGDESSKLDADDSMERGHSSHSGHTSSNHPALFKLHNPKYKMLEKRKSFACREGRPVENPQWEGGLFDCSEEPTISVLTTLCFPCVMGFNYERLGFGNRYVHMATFLLLLVAPFLIFNLAAINLNGVVRTSLGVSGIALCVFSLLYGGFWRIKIRERYKLPSHPWCCKQPKTSDCFQWLFCPFCSLCQEVRTAEAYDVRNDRFFVRSIAHAHTSGGGNSPVSTLDIHPLPGSPMVHIKDRDLSPGEQAGSVDLTILFPPPAQTVDPK
ncbi:hypothetical protein KC19_11G090000 [Ceratodon purpureus]|uniref:Uncharacterized protein n=1 Tax=Ceratodon purpureus TaxID=3225 RepID=A0A8T0GFL1_CERPU|nr:hypothetical protein KC19_11G090000 [Ceratodon purpureus]